MAAVIPPIPLGKIVAVNLSLAPTFISALS